MQPIVKLNNLFIIQPIYLTMKSDSVEMVMTVLSPTSGWFLLLQLVQANFFQYPSAVT